MELSHLINNAQHMPNIPQIVQELIKSFGDEAANSDEIAGKLSKDQAMTAKVLRMANSAKYGGHHSVGSVNDAVVLLGFNALRTMVLASGLTAAFPTPDGFDIKEFWIRSFGIATVSKWVAKYVPDTDAEIAFTCGMVHNIGNLLTYMLVNEEAQEIDKVVAQGADRVEMENSRLGFNFTEAGAELAHRWKFPEDIVDGIRHQLEPEVAEDNYKKLAGVIYIAKYLYDYLEEDNDTLTANFPAEHGKALNMDMVGLMNKLDELKTLDSGIEEFL